MNPKEFVHNTAYSVQLHYIIKGLNDLFHNTNTDCCPNIGIRKKNNVFLASYPS